MKTSKAMEGTNFNESIKDSKSSLTSQFKNLNFYYIYKNQSDAIFKILFDRYYRPEVYSIVDKTNINSIKLEREKLKKILFNDLYFPINEILINDPSQEHIDSEKEELAYLKQNLKFCKLNMLNNVLMVLIISDITLYWLGENVKALKKFRYSKAFKILKPSIFFTLMNAFFLQIYIIFAVRDYNGIRNPKLELKYRRAVEKYNLILQ